MARLFFLFSGEHETLPVSELKAILETEDHAHKTLEKLDQVLRLEADLRSIEAVERRAALTRLCGLELFSCKAEISTILKSAGSANLEEALKNAASFAVRVKHVKNYSSEIDGMMLERKLGKLVINKEKRVKVNLRNPDRTLVGILTEGRFLFGSKLAEITPKTFVDRRPKKKPFFHPSAMPPKLARCMVNLAKPEAGELVLDPFCGTGSILIEAALIGCRVLGEDIQRRMVKGSLRNLSYFSFEPEGIIVADAKNMPVTKVDCVVTDPPYGISTTTLKRTTRQIVKEVLMSVHGLLDKGRRVCIATPKTLDIAHLGLEFGFKCLESHLVYVHRSLTREIAILKKV